MTDAPARLLVVDDDPANLLAIEVALGGHLQVLSPPGGPTPAPG